MGGGAEKYLFVLDGEGRLAALSNPLLRLLDVSERRLLGRFASDVFDGAADLLVTGTSGSVHFRSANGARWQALLTVELLPVTRNRCTVPVGTLSGLRAASSEEPDGANRRRGPRASDAATFGEAIRRLTKGNGAPVTLTTGRIELIGLEEVKAALGAKWPAYAERAKASARSVISKRLTDADMFAESGADTFVICFASLSASEAAVKSELIAREIRERLVGEDTPGFNVVPQVTEVQLEEHDLDDCEDVTLLLIRRLDAARAQYEKTATIKMKEVLDSSRLSLAPVLGPPRESASLVMARLSLTKAPWLHQMGNSEEGSKMAFELDRILLGLSIEHLYEHFMEGDAASMIVPVTYSTLCDKKNLEDYMSLCRRMNETIRNRLLIKLAGIPSNLPQSRLQETLSLLSPFCAQRILRVPSLEYSFPDLGSAQVAMVAVVADRAHMSDKNKSGVFKKFATTARRSGGYSHTRQKASYRILVSDVQDQDMADWYRSNGADFISFA